MNTDYTPSNEQDGAQHSPTDDTMPTFPESSSPNHSERDSDAILSSFNELIAKFEREEKVFVGLGNNFLPGRNLHPEVMKEVEVMERVLRFAFAENLSDSENSRPGSPFESVMEAYQTFDRQLEEYADGEVPNSDEELIPFYQSADAMSFIASVGIAAVRGILENEECYKNLLNCDGMEAQIILNVIQKLIDGPFLEKEHHGLLVKTMLRISERTGLFPSCLTLSHVEIGEKLVATGQFREVRMGKFQGYNVCLKIIGIYEQAQAEHLLKKFVCEAIVWSRLVHPNVLPFYGLYYMEEDDKVCLVSPWMENGNVTEYLERNPAVSKLALMHDVIEGLKYLHENHIVHGDMKGLNVLVDPWGRACLGDFGLSSMIDVDILKYTSLEDSTELGGTIRWAAPEVLDPTEDEEVARPTFASDIWSLAAVFYEILTGLVPYHEYTRVVTVIYQKVELRKLPSRPSQEIAPELTDDIWALMLDCWKFDHEERPKIDEISCRLPKVEKTKTSQDEFEEHLVKKIIAFRRLMYGQNLYMAPYELEPLFQIFHPGEDAAEDRSDRNKWVDDGSEDLGNGDPDRVESSN